MMANDVPSKHNMERNRKKKGIKYERRELESKTSPQKNVKLSDHQRRCNRLIFKSSNDAEPRPSKRRRATIRGEILG